MRACECRKWARMASSSCAVNAVLSRPSFDPLNAIEPVVQFSREPLVLAVGANPG